MGPLAWDRGGDVTVIMSGYYDKIGNLSEKEYVVYQLLCLLNESVSSVKWESVYEELDEHGVDLWVENLDGRIAIQCKTKSSGRWTPASLASGDRSILSHAVVQLQGREPESQAAEFVFATNNTPVVELDRLCLDARNMNDDQWGDREFSKEERVICETLGADFRELLKRIRVEALLPKALLGNLSTTLVGPDQSSRLLEELKSLVDEDVFGKIFYKPDLVRELSEGLVFRESISPITLSECIKKQNLKHMHWVQASRIFDPIPREETQQVIEKLNHDRSWAVVVEGDAGIGKSDVLAGVVQECLNDHRPVLALCAKEAQELSQEVPPGRFAAYGGRGSVVIMDQWDQMELSENSEGAKKNAWNYLSQCRDLGVRVVVGCRSVDVNSDRQLSNLLNSFELKPDIVPVGLLPEKETGKVLNEIGIPWGDLGHEWRMLVRNPMVLGILYENRGSDLQKITNIREVVLAWLDRILGSLDRGYEVLDQLIEALERSGGIAISPNLIPNGSTILATMKRMRLIKTMDDGRVGLTHQLIADVRLGRSLAKSENLKEVCLQLGPREHQGMFHARRLRQAVSLMVTIRGGLELIGEIEASDSIRPLVKRGLYLGMADVTNPKVAQWKLVESWFLDPEKQPVVAQLILNRNAHWTRMLLRSVCDSLLSYDRPLQENILGLLSSTTSELGEDLADALLAWEKAEPGFLSRKDASWMFRQDPQFDSDKLFDLRMKWPNLDKEIRSGGLIFEWEKLMELYPTRFVRLLAQFFKVKGDDILDNSPSGDLVLLTTCKEIPHSFLNAAPSILCGLKAIWADISLPTVWGMESENSFSSGTVSAWYSKFFAKVLAHIDQSDPDASKKHIPFKSTSEPREQDIWLNLFIGSTLLKNQRDTADRLLRWFTLELDWKGRILSNYYGLWQSPLVLNFVKYVGGLASEPVFLEFEEKTVDFQDPWSVDDERDRWDWVQKRGMIFGNDVGKTAYHFLSQFTDEKLSVRGKSKRKELEAKFGKYKHKPKEFYDDYTEDIVAPAPVFFDKRTPKDWSKQFDWALKIDSKTPDETVSWSTRKKVDSVLDRLTSFAQKNPRRYLDYFIFFAQSSHPAREKILPELFESITLYSGSNQHPPDLTPEEIEKAVLDHGLADELSMVREIALFVQKHLKHKWSEEIVNGLFKGAQSVLDRPDDNSNEEGYHQVRYQRSDCCCLQAVAALGQHDDARAKRVIDLAEHLLSSGQIPLIAEAVYACGLNFSTEPLRCGAIIVRACETVPISSDTEVLQTLRFVAHKGVTDEIRRKAIDQLFALGNHPSDRIQSAVGRMSVWLLHDEKIGQDTFFKFLKSDENVRAAVASTIPKLLQDPVPKTWVIPLTKTLNQDESEKVRTALRRSIRRDLHHRIFDFPDLVEDLFSNDVDADIFSSILEVFDQHSKLRSHSDVLLNQVGYLKPLLLDKAEPLMEKPWAIRRRVEKLEGYLLRLLEEVERHEEDELRIKILDALDNLMQASPDFALSSIRARTL